MTILITGASGFIGKHLCSYFNKQKHTVIALTKNKQTIDGCSKVIPCNLLDSNNSLIEIKKEVTEKVDCIINLATEFTNNNLINEIQVLNNNITITNTVIEISKHLNINKMINFSSIAVYPNKDGIYNETSIIEMSCNTECIYGLSKFCSENIISYSLKSSNIEIIHLRVAQVYGEGMRDDRIMSIMKQELLETGKITVFGEGERISNFISIEKLSTVINFFINKKTYGVFNVGEEELSYKQLALKVIKTEKTIGEIIYKKSGSKAKFHLDITKLNELLKRKTINE